MAATGSDDSLASFSNFGATSVDIGAPGVSILSTLSGGGYGLPELSRIGAALEKAGKDGNAREASLRVDEELASDAVDRALAALRGRDDDAESP